MTVTSALVTNTTADCHIPTIWSAETADAMEAKVVLAGLVDRRFEKELQVGRILNIPYIHNLTAQTKAISTNVSTEAYTETAQSITVSSHEFVAFGIENLVQVQSKTNLRSKYTERGGYVIGASMDETLAVGAASFANSVGTLGQELSDDNIIRAWQYLADFDTPDTDRFIYLSPAAYAGLMKLDKFMHSDYIGGAGRGVREAYVGKLYGSNVYTSTLCYTPASGQAQGWFSQKGGFALIQQEMKTRSDYSIHQDADIVLMTNIFGSAEILYPPKTEVNGSTIAPLDYRNVLLNTIG